MRAFATDITTYSGYSICDCTTTTCVCQCERNGTASEIVWLVKHDSTAAKEEDFEKLVFEHDYNWDLEHEKIFLFYICSVSVKYHKTTNYIRAPCYKINI